MLFFYEKVLITKHLETNAKQFTFFKYKNFYYSKNLKQKLQKRT